MKKIPVDLKNTEGFRKLFIGLTKCPQGNNFKAIKKFVKRAICFGSFIVLSNLISIKISVISFQKILRMACNMPFSFSEKLDVFRLIKVVDKRKSL